MDDILSDTSLDRLDRIERLESLLAAATHHALPSPAPSSATTPLASNCIQKVFVDAETQVHLETIILNFLRLSFCRVFF